jgi:2-polyprenyl-3-methyl-5-hydroxy-6-metoxy-1,4-benzoquinol methylase
MLLTRQSQIVESQRPKAFVWEDVNCLLCGNYDSDLLIEAADPLPPEKTGLRFAIVRCRNCGLRYTNPRPDPSSISQFYPPGYGPHSTHESRRQRIPSRFWSWVFGRPCLERRGALPCSTPGRLLDFGCGGGSYLRRMHRQGWTVTGLDVAAEVIHKLRKDFDCRALIGSLPHDELQPSSFEVITMWQTLEHVHQPLAVLRSAYQLLVPGGYLVVAVPNSDSWAAQIFGSHWFGLDLPRHLTHFTPHTLRAMVQVAGFRVVSLRGIVHAEWLRSSVRHAEMAEARTVLTRLLSWKLAARVGAWLSYVVGRADCLVALAQRPM